MKDREGNPICPCSSCITIRRYIACGLEVCKHDLDQVREHNYACKLEWALGGDKEEKEFEQALAEAKKLLDSSKRDEPIPYHWPLAQIVQASPRIRQIIELLVQRVDLLEEQAQI